MQRFGILIIVSATYLVMGCDSTTTPGFDMNTPSDGGGPGTISDAGPASELGVSGAVPTSPAALFSFLKSAQYKTFAAESAAHQSEGPHDQVRTFINPTLLASLQASSATHPVGSAAVKELYESDGKTLKGWAVEVKTQTDSANGNGWYWYEIFDTESGENPAVDGKGVGTCTGCHSDGKDYVLTRYPLR